MSSKFHHFNEEENDGECERVSLTNIPPTDTNSHIPLLDQLVEERGYNLITYNQIFLTSLVLAVEGLHMLLFSSMIIPLTMYLQLTPSQVKFTSAILFLGVGLGSFVSGYSTLRFGRPLIINSFLAVIFVSHVTSSLTTNYLTFALCRLSIGFGLGLIVPVTLNLLTEYLPLKRRSFVLTSVWTSFTCGSSFLLIVMLTIMPNFELTQVSNALLITSALPLVTLFINLYMCNDSPRNLILRHQDREALELLERIIGTGLSEEQKARIVQEVRGSGTNAELSNNLLQIFNKKFLLLTALLMFIWAYNSVMAYGPFAVCTLTMKKLAMEQKENTFTNRQIIVDQIVIGLIGMPFNFFGGILSELSALGRNKSTLLNYGLGLLALILLIIYPEYFTFFFALYQSFLGVAFSINTTYTCEVYPTKIRDQAVGFLFFCTRVGGFLSQIVYLHLNDIGVFVPYYFTIGIMMLTIGFVYFLPFETYGHHLDMDYKEANKEAKK